MFYKSINMLDIPNLESCVAYYNVGLVTETDNHIDAVKI